MTNTPLTIIAVLLAVRIILQIRQGKSAFEKSYAAVSDIEYHVEFCNIDVFAINRKLSKFAKDKWEIAAIERTDVSGDDCFVLFFTRKKIKNFYEE